MRRPYVVVGGLMSIDGKIAPVDRNGLKFTPLMGETLRKELHRIRSQVDAVLVGIGTVLAYPTRETPRLTVRLVNGRNPLRIVLDSKARTPTDASIVNAEAPTVVVVSDKAPKRSVRRLEALGIDVLRCGYDKIDLRRLMDNLVKRGVRKLFVEGGGEVRWSFVKEKLVDEFFVWIIPSVWGGRMAPTLVEGEGFTEAKDALFLQLLEMKVVDDVLCLKFRPRKDVAHSRRVKP